VGRNFPHPSRTRPEQPWGPPSLLYNAYRLFSVGKAAGAWCWPPTSSSAEVKERVELYLYFPSRPPWSVLGWHLYANMFRPQGSSSGITIKIQQRKPICCYINNTCIQNGILFLP